MELSALNGLEITDVKITSTEIKLVFNTGTKIKLTGKNIKVNYELGDYIGKTIKSFEAIGADEESDKFGSAGIILNGVDKIIKLTSDDGFIGDIEELGELKKYL